MRLKMIGCACLVLVACLMSGIAMAETQFGVAVYPEATQHAGTTKFLKEGLGVDGVAYQTKDPASAVIEFYKSQDGIREIFVSDESAMFRKGDEVDVTVQSPWMDMDTGKLMQDCLISIVKR